MSIGEYYNVCAASYFKLNESGFNFTPERFHEFFQSLGVKSMIFDAGCGPGVESIELRKMGHTVSGVDVSESMVELYQVNCPGSEARVSDLKELPYLDGSFDVVLSSFSLVHSDPKEILAILREFRRVSRPFAKIFIATGIAPTDLQKLTTAHRFVRDLNLKIDPIDFYFLTEKSWRELILSSGLSVEKVQVDLIQGVNIVFIELSKLI